MEICDSSFSSFIYVEENASRASNNHPVRYHENESRIDHKAKSEANL